VYVSITDSPDTAPDAGHPGRTGSRAVGPGHDGDEAVTCTLTSTSGATTDLGTFTLRDGRASWATPTSIDAHTLAQAQLTIGHGHTLARATFTLSQAVKTPDDSKDRNKAKDEARQDSKEGSKDGGKDEAREGAKDKDSPDDTKDATGDKSGDNDKDRKNHKRGGKNSDDGEHILAPRSAGSGDGHDGSAGLSGGITKHLSDHTPARGQHGSSRHDGGRHARTSAGGDHRGGHHPHGSNEHGSVTVNLSH
jgi:hypothetical protein